jgi:hypothetical protein
MLMVLFLCGDGPGVASTESMFIKTNMATAFDESLSNILKLQVPLV